MSHVAQAFQPAVSPTFQSTPRPGDEISGLPVSVSSFLSPIFCSLPPSPASCFLSPVSRFSFLSHRPFVIQKQLCATYTYSLR
jgi:hypothetical protein